MKKLYQYDKFGVFRPKEEAEEANKSFGYCQDCNKLVTSDGNSKAVRLKVVKHKICK